MNLPELHQFRYCTVWPETAYNHPQVWHHTNTRARGGTSKTAPLMASPPKVLKYPYTQCSPCDSASQHALTVTFLLPTRCCCKSGPLSALHWTFGIGRDGLHPAKVGEGPRHLEPPQRSIVQSSLRNVPRRAANLLYRYSSTTT